MLIFMSRWFFLLHFFLCVKIVCLTKWNNLIIFMYRWIKMRRWEKPSNSNNNCLSMPNPISSSINNVQWYRFLPTMQQCWNCSNSNGAVCSSQWLFTLLNSVNWCIQNIKGAEQKKTFWKKMKTIPPVIGLVENWIYRRKQQKSSFNLRVCLKMEIQQQEHFE